MTVQTPQPAETLWQQGQLVEIEITDLSDRGDGVGRFGQRVVFVPDTVTGDRVKVRLVRVKPQYAHGKLLELLEPSPHRVRPSCIVADKCGGCQWQQVSYAYQLEAKRNQVIQALERIGGFQHIAVEPVLPGSEPLAYRNKATYPLRYKTDGDSGAHVQAGYFQKGSHHIINLNQCPIQDQRLNPLLAEVKQDIQRQGWQVYDETRHRGTVRHLSLRIGRRTGEILLTFVVKDWHLSGLEEQAQAWLQRYPDLVGVCLNRNPDRTNTIFGTETRCVVGQSSLREEFAGLQFQIQPTTFFQIHTEQAEALLQVMLTELNLQGNEIVLDAYSGIGTLTLPIAQQAKQAIGIEIQPEAVVQAQHNAQLNHLENVTFLTGTVEQMLPVLEVKPSVVLLDPPRRGCEAIVLQTLLTMQPERIVYVSCNSATLARDLKLLCADGQYQIAKVQPADFFPQTAHVECAVFLQKIENSNSGF